MADGSERVGDLAEVIEVAREAAIEAGELLLESFGRLQSSQIGTKSSARDLVTEADFASERLLVERLREAFPRHRIESEEEVHDAPDDGAPRWFLDPLDGTVNFVHGLPAFAVSMGLWAGGEPLAAVVHLPRLEETFCAVRGGGTWLGKRRQQVSKTAELGRAVLATGFPYRRGELEHSNLENFNRFFYDLRGIRRMGAAAVDLAYVAAGRLDGFWELHLSPHDVAAGGLLVREAGGLVTDADGGEDWLRGGHVVAAGPALQPQIRARVEH
ncbi:MAG: inositol monophosphatase family protein [Planctomycetota bacterium]|jgi:myo-inositol-1(or 4)-monophosphatase|nr:inositol monophosphatase family protein [Planctomycetota bacterium]MDP6764033.1 inositol monophosphatase family protein [Planctomycetota bacterium]MDP6988001.1 inositol monophosphatase family protein [Planctomycetota bacterium]